MPPITNFSANHDESDSEFFWKHDDKQLTVEVSKQKSKYRTIVSSEENTREIVPICDSCDGARKIAVSWMKNNPRPDIS
jgi:hypothetical protein